MGRQRADTMMAYLPPTGWADVARQRDLDLLAAELRAEMADGFRRQTQWFAGGFLAMAALNVAAIGVAARFL